MSQPTGCVKNELSIVAKVGPRFPERIRHAQVTLEYWLTTSVMANRLKHANVPLAVTADRSRDSDHRGSGSLGGSSKKSSLSPYRQSLDDPFTPDLLVTRLHLTRWRNSQTCQTCCGCIDRFVYGCEIELGATIYGTSSCVDDC